MIKKEVQIDLTNKKHSFVMGYLEALFQQTIIDCSVFFHRATDMWSKEAFDLSIRFSKNDIEYDFLVSCERIEYRNYEEISHLLVAQIQKNKIFEGFST